MPPEHERLIQIRNLIRKCFNLEEFRDLCFDLGVSYDDLGRDGLYAQIREIITLCDRTGRVEHLLALCAQRRPYVSWPQPKIDLNQPVTYSHLTPPAQNPYQIFISHAHQDTEFAYRLANDLRRQGWNIWIAPESIRPGERWVTAINRGLAESSIFLLVLTPAAVQSHWVQDETNAAIEMAHQGEIRFIPLQVQPTHKPPLWRMYQWISFQGEYEIGLAHLQSALLLESVVSKLGFTRVWAKDGKEMVYVPAGEFLYGDRKKKVYLDGFWIDKTPVTNVEYKRFLDANPNHRVPFLDWDDALPYNWDEKERTYPLGKENHPVVLVSWYDAKAYTDWAGKRLVTEREWEKAARGTDGRKYPWGKWESGRANTKEAGIRGSSWVGEFSPQGDSPYGCVDMSGNVWEWTDDWYEKNKYQVIRGGSWLTDKTYGRCAARYWFGPSYRDWFDGFRSAVSKWPNTIGIIK